MKKIVAIIVVALIVIIGGAVIYANRNNLYGNSSPSPSPSADMSNMSQSPAASAAPTATSTVTIDNFAFSPAAITVKKGTTVTWTNNDSTTHTVTETDGQNGPQSSNLATGKSYSFTYNTVGTFKYHCSIHPSMTGSVTVTE